VPHVEHTHSWLIWGYFAVGLFSATLMPYEIYFYSSGAIEEGWQAPEDRDEGWDYNAALDLIDVELVDVHGAPCGRVAEIELDGEVGGALELTALQVGVGAWRTRLPSWLQWVAGGEPVRIPWAEVLDIGTSVRLAKPAADYGLNRSEARLGRRLSRVPGS
jgi:hypothetical protein